MTNVADKATLTKRNLWPVVIAAVLALYYALPLLLKITWWGVRDWDLFTTIAAAPVGCIEYYGQFPFWNPWMGGGNILFHHPEVLVISPFLLLYLLFGAVAGLKLQVLICYFTGFWGSQRLGQRLGLSIGAAVVFAVAWFGSVHFALHFAEGHMPFTHYCFLPWFFYFVLSAPENRRAVVWAALVLALMILGNGAAIPLLYTLSFTGLMVLLLAVRDRTSALLARWLGAVVLGCGLAAVKFLPMVIYLLQNTWEGNPQESIPFSALGAIFFGTEHSLFVENFPEQFWAWHEYGAYLSPLLLVAAIWAFRHRMRRLWPWLVAALAFLLLGLGDFGWCSPWALVSHLPGFSSARCTGRAFQFVLLALGFVGALGIDMLWRRAGNSRRTQFWRGWLSLGAMVVVVTNLVFAWPIISSANRQPPKDITRHDEFRQAVNDKLAYENYLANRGSLITPWLSAYHPSRGLVDADSTAHMEHLLTGQARSLSRRYTPNRIEYSLEVIQPGAMVIGMGYDPGWRALDGRPLRPTQGLITFELQPGQDQVTLVYRTPYFYAGLVLNLLAAIAAVLLVKRRTGSRTEVLRSAS
jgi:hypothetical protein